MVAVPGSLGADQLAETDPLPGVPTDARRGTREGCPGERYAARTSGEPGAGGTARGVVIGSARAGGATRGPLRRRPSSTACEGRRCRRRRSGSIRWRSWSGGRWTPRRTRLLRHRSPVPEAMRQSLPATAAAAGEATTTATAATVLTAAAVGTPDAPGAGADTVAGARTSRSCRTGAPTELGAAGAAGADCRAAGARGRRDRRGPAGCSHTTTTAAAAGLLVRVGSAAAAAESLAIGRSARRRQLVSEVDLAPDVAPALPVPPPPPFPVHPGYHHRRRRRRRRREGWHTAIPPGP